MADLSWTTSWDSVLSYNNQLLPNNYTITVSFDILTDDAEKQTVAFERMKYFVDKVMQDAIFSSIDDERNSYYQDNFEQRLVTFPIPPQDLAVVTALFMKFKMITEGKIDIQQISISSVQGEGVTIHYDEDFAGESTMLTEHELLKAADREAWWSRDDCGSADFFKMDAESEMLTFVTDVTDWESTGLTYPLSEVEKKDASNWKPTIITGGKTRH